MNEIMFGSREEFRAWLTENCLSDKGVWLIFGKSGGPVTIKAGEALEEALCFGWIDGQMQSIDEKSYRKYFKQRAPASVWSEKNKKLAEKLEAHEMMTDHGRVKIETAKQNGSWDAPKAEPLADGQLMQFEDMLRPYGTAYENFIKMPTSMSRAYASSYFLGTKTEEGKRKRFETIVERLELNMNPMESMAKKKEQVKKEQEGM